MKKPRKFNECIEFIHRIDNLTRAQRKEEEIEGIKKKLLQVTGASRIEITYFYDTDQGV
jgi:hypothetical protein